MKIHVLTLFPEYFSPLISCGVVGHALSGKRGQHIEIHFVNIRDYSPDHYKGVDDEPYGGGGGMVMRPDILRDSLIKGVFNGKERSSFHVVYLSPRGQVWNNQLARSFSTSEKELVLVCGRYEGIDERFIDLYVDQLISIGDFVLSGGEIAAQAMIDSILRFIPGVLGNSAGPDEESFEGGLLEYPHYTRPREFEGLEVPPVLLSGNHKMVNDYRAQMRLEITKRYRPDLLKK